jgi:hypothetical protein
MDAQLLKAVQPVIDWLKASIDVHNGHGSAAWYHPIKGWAPAYPETTGYLIPTLLEWSILTSDHSLAQRALDCANWLCTIQRTDGAFPGGVGIQGDPLTFDTGQILLGLAAAYKHTGDQTYFDALQWAAHWLSTTLDDDGIWRKHLYVQGHVPAYHSRVVWALFEAAGVLGDARLQTDAVRSYMAHLTYLDAQHPMWIRDAGSRPATPVYLHFYAYVLEGLLESARYTQDETISSRLAATMLFLGEMIQTRQHLPGSIHPKGQGDFSFRCLTGEAQMARVFMHYGTLCKEEIWQQYALQLLTGIQPSWIPLKGFRGGLSGSLPVWGSYMKWCFPNWAAKFYLDGIATLHTNQRLFAG